jgi:hypothetical protein
MEVEFNAPYKYSLTENVVLAMFPIVSPKLLELNAQENELKEQLKVFISI